MTDLTKEPLRPAVVLLAEDNDNDVELTRLSFKRSKIACELHVVGDGEECMAFLRREGIYADAPFPDLLLLDLNMPRKGGGEVMAEIAEDPDLCHLPVVILTTSSSDAEILKMYQLRCSSYIVKPLDFIQFQRCVAQITDYWFELVVRPKK
ncbi:MAG: response regulator [Burkholderiales bacterium]|nr:response regulator [Burkholderiales bacterium]